MNISAGDSIASSRGTAAAAIGMAAIGVLMFMSLPAVMQIWVNSHGLSDAQAGTASSLHLGALAMASLVVSVLVSRLSYRILMAVGLLVAGCGDGLMINADNASTTMTAAAITGFGAGMIYSTGAAVLARLAHTSRNYSFLLFTQVLFSAIALWLFPGIDLGAGDRSMFALLGLIHLGFLLALPLIPHQTGSRADSETPASQHSEGQTRAISAISALASLSLFYLAVGMIWTYIGRRAIATGFAEDSLGVLLSLGNLISLGGCVLAWWISERYPTQRILLYCLGLISGCFFLLGINVISPLFMIAVASFLFCWNIVDVFQLTTISNVDDSGKYVALVPFCQAAGTTAGPALGGLMIAAGSDIASLMTFCSVLVLLALALVTLSGREAKALEPVAR
ncbi:MAG: MFS transporter [Halioglobus sp.]